MLRNFFPNPYYNRKTLFAKTAQKKNAAACNGCNASQSLFSFPFRLPKSLLPLLSVFAIPVRSYRPAARRAAAAVYLFLRIFPGKRAGLKLPFFKDAAVSRGIGQKTGQYGVGCDVIGYGSHLLSVASCYAVKTAFSGIKDKCIGYPLRAVKKALIYGLLS